MSAAYFIYIVVLRSFVIIFQALHYCEVISRTIQQSPGAYGQALVHSVLDLASRLKYHDPQRLQEEDMDDPEWLVALEKTCQAFDVRFILLLFCPLNPVEVGQVENKKQMILILQFTAKYDLH